MEKDEEIGAMCEAHPATPLTLWCTADRVLVCYKCLLFGEHKGHQCLEEEETK